ncbi:uncharacterized protein LOC132062667 [Lycium ferocissimum]|uniref:uncharacterized protein LOC132062667 n=1 Tax=Lycium ferocissimum TaxID=112874 RepID=UPI0028169095|nr:uncharacterized protein LOC132062667 [Lycium ferocissimum]
MANLTKLEFVALDISGKNYLSWVLDLEIHLDAMGLGDTIKENNKASNQENAKAMIFLRHHLDEDLKIEYLTIKDPLVLWKNLKERYDHLKMVFLPKARHEWINLRLQDFKSVMKYNSEMFRITSILTLCGEKISDSDKLEKTFSTFHASNVLLQQQYREKDFTKYCDLITHLLVAEQNNDLLMKNHENRPTGAAPLPEVNEVYAHHSKRGKGRGPGRGHDNSRGRDNSRSRGRDNGQRRNYFHGVNHSSKKNHHRKGKKKDDRHEVPEARGSENKCYRCGGSGHWARTCRMAKHLVELYQTSIKRKEKNPRS